LVWRAVGQGLRVLDDAWRPVVAELGGEALSSKGRAPWPAIHRARVARPRDGRARLVDDVAELFGAEHEPTARGPRSVLVGGGG